VGVAAAAPGEMRDLRDWLAAVEALGELRRVDREVDWDEEAAAVTYMVAKAMGERAPALLFERIRGHPGRAALFNIMGPSVNRVALSVGLPPGLPVMECIRLARERLRATVPPVQVPQDEAPINEVVLTGDAVDLTRLPAPRMWPLDGGRYAGTSDVCVTRDPEGGWLNLGSYRMMLHGPRELGFFTSPGRDARRHYEACWRRGEPCPVAVALGADPLLLAVAGTTFPRNRSEYEFAGGLRGRAVEVVPGLATDLLVPARAEIVVEGVLRPGRVRPEGPFGEFTGYYGRPTADSPVLEVQAMRMRRDGILTCGLMADHPACEHAMLACVIRSARIWDDLEAMGVPGVRGVYSHPAAALYGLLVVSLEQRHAGHAQQVLALTAQVPSGSYYTKWIVAVDEDVDPSDLNQVIWAMSTRCNPADDVDLLRRTESTWLDPSQNPPSKRPYGSKALITACREHRHIGSFSPRTALRRRVYERVAARWAELDLPGAPPQLPALVEEGAQADPALFDPALFEDPA
jgi:UbiD family decarboxylase